MGFRKFMKTEKIEPVKKDEIELPEDEKKPRLASIKPSK